MKLGERKDRHVFNALYKNISNVNTTKVYNTGIPTAIPERIDDLIYGEIESQIISITYTLLWN